MLKVSTCIITPFALLLVLLSCSFVDPGAGYTVTTTTTLADGMTVHFKLPDGWMAAKIHYWDTADGSTSWPGLEMTEESNGWYSYTFPNAEAARMVFNNDSSPQTGDLYHENSEGWYSGGIWYDANPDLYPSTGAIPPTGSFYGDVTITLQASGPGPLTLHYTSDGSNPMTDGISFSDGDQITAGADLATGECFTLRLYADNGDTTADAEYTYTKTDRPQGFPDTGARPTTVTTNGRWVYLPGFTNSMDLPSREVRIYLPRGYDTTTDSYRVVYMHDGQNQFENGGFGSWDADENYDIMADAGHIHPAILVGIWCTADRMSEYSTSSSGEAYSQFVIQDLKRYIDRNYRSLYEAEYTSVLGSSLGGLVSAYQGWQHGDIFGNSGCVSPSFWYEDRSFLNSILEYSGSAPSTRFWADGGTNEGSNMVEYATDFINKLESLGMTRGRTHQYECYMLSVAGAGHNEAAWSARIDQVLYFLIGKTDMWVDQ